MSQGIEMLAFGIVENFSSEGVRAGWASGADGTGHKAFLLRAIAGARSIFCKVATRSLTLAVVSTLLLTGAKTVDARPLVDRIIVKRVNGKPLATFSADRLLGASIDGTSKGEAAAMFTTSNLVAMRSAGFTHLAYRLRTELANEAWHWSADGKWSDLTRHQGYWTGNEQAREHELLTLGTGFPVAATRSTRGIWIH